MIERAKIRKRLLANFPEYFCYKYCFFLKNSIHILNGFYCDFSSSGVFLRRFTYPIFDNADDVNLVYSEEIGGKRTFVSFQDKSLEEFMVDLVGKIRHFEEFLLTHPPMSVPQFLHYISAHPHLSVHIHCQLTIASSKVLNGEYVGALKDLVCIEKKLSRDDLKFCQVLIKLLQCNPSEAIDHLKAIESKKKDLIGI